MGCTAIGVVTIMSEEKELFPLDIIDDILSGGKETPSDTTITIEDASTRTAEVLAPELGSDDEWKREGKVDWRRFGHLSKTDPFWMTHFRLKKKFRGGNYTKDYAEEIGNLKFSVGGRHKRISVDMQQATLGNKGTPDKPKKKRGLFDSIFRRNRDDE
jgi:hypothetical protein